MSASVAEYVYGVVEDRARAPTAPGVRGAEVKLITSDGPAALVSELEADSIRLGREEMLAHMRVLADAFSHGTVLPMRFGVVMEDAEAVRTRLLEPHATDLRAQLASLAGKVELGIRVTFEEAALMREIVAENPDIARIRKSLQGRPDDATYYERIELGERVAAAVQRKAQREGQRIVDALSLAAVDADVRDPAHERVALNAAFLVERSRLEEFDEVLEALARAHAERLRFACNGPLPPHSFVQFAGGD